MFATLYRAFIHLYAGRVDHVARLVLGVWIGGCFMDWLIGAMTVGSVVWSLAVQLALCALALTLKLRDQARQNNTDQER